MNLDVLYEDNHCLAVNKPAGLPSQGDETGSESLVDLVTRYLRMRYAKPGNVYVGLLHRLDRPTSGVVLLAKTSKAAGRLSAQFRAGTIAKVYWAIVEGGAGEERGRMDRPTREGPSDQSLAHPGGGEFGWEGGAGRFPGAGTLGGRDEAGVAAGDGAKPSAQGAVGRSGLPIVGDAKYGAKSRIVASDGRWRIALHARELTFMHPTRGESIAVVAPVPADWPEPLTGGPARWFASSKPGGCSNP